MPGTRQSRAAASMAQHGADDLDTDALKIIELEVLQAAREEA
jgi:hypothetical protein